MHLDIVQKAYWIKEISYSQSRESVYLDNHFRAEFCPIIYSNGILRYFLLVSAISPMVYFCYSSLSHSDMENQSAEWLAYNTTAQISYSEFLNNNQGHVGRRTLKTNIMKKLVIENWTYNTPLQSNRSNYIQLKHFTQMFGDINFGFSRESGLGKNVQLVKAFSWSVALVFCHNPSGPAYKFEPSQSQESMNLANLCGLGCRFTYTLLFSHLYSITIPHKVLKVVHSSRRLSASVP